MINEGKGVWKRGRDRIKDKEKKDYGNRWKSHRRKTELRKKNMQTEKVSDNRKLRKKTMKTGKVIEGKEN